MAGKSRPVGIEPSCIWALETAVRQTACGTFIRAAKFERASRLCEFGQSRCTARFGCEVHQRILWWYHQGTSGWTHNSGVYIIYKISVSFNVWKRSVAEQKTTNPWKATRHSGGFDDWRSRLEQLESWWWIRGRTSLTLEICSNPQFMSRSKPLNTHKLFTFQTELNSTMRWAK